MGMYDNLKDIVTVFRNDETLLRLLYYPAEDLTTNTPDPLDISLQNILSMNEDMQWEIRDEHIMLIPKGSDLEEKKLCRIFLYAGRRQSTGNYLAANQQVIVDILCHMNYEKDLRSMRISDRINELLVAENVTGIGKMDYFNGSPISAPKDYIGFQHIYEFSAFKKR
jgi:hypothetical protein